MSCQLSAGRHACRIAAALAVLALPLAGPPAAAQQLPPPSEIQQLLQNPQAAEAIRQRILRSGLTPDQIRAQLQAAGYPASLFDDFLSGQRGALLTPSDTVLSAMGALGLGTTRQLQTFADSVRLAAFHAAAPAPEPVGLQVFGLQVFRRPSSQFLPDVAGPVDAHYRLGAGDVLVLILTGDVELIHTLQITREGFVVIPQVGQVPVANLTMEQLRRVLRERLGRSYSGIRTGTTQFEVTVTQVRMIQVYAIGEVARPGSYQLPSVSTVVTALHLAGGPTARGNFREVVVRRGRDTVAVLDLYDYLLTGDAAQDVRLESGDVIFVPVHGPRITVTGAVVRPAVYELKPGETLAELVAAAGGFRADAMLERVAVHRILPAPERGPGPAPRAVIDVPLIAESGREAAGGDSDGRDGAVFAGVLVPGLGLENGDSVVVDSVGPLNAGLYVTVTGMVRKPGRYAWRAGMTLKDLVLLARGPRIGADLREAEIARLPDDRMNGELADTLRVPLDSSYLFLGDSAAGYRGAPGAAFAPPGSAPTVALEPFDQATILRQPAFELQRTVAITGEVRFPGSYALTRKDERLSDLVARAGGLVPSAYPEGARFVRRLDETGRVDVELAAALARRGSRADVVLQPGDSLHIPEFNPTVRVTGAVNSPTSVLYRDGAGLDYYIENAGGYAHNADKGRLSVRYANGSARVRSKFLFFAAYPEPGPGSVVFVPERTPRPPTNLVALFGTIAQVVASTATIVIVLTR